MKISLCVITRNEATSLPKMLSSVSGVVDEVVICDTGSTDDTPQVAKQLADVFVQHSRSDEWREHRELFSFADARNESMQAATGDWILILDCDEVLPKESGEKLRALLRKVPKHVDLILPEMIMCTDHGRPYQKFLCERLIRGKKGITFAGDMHNFVEVGLGKERAIAPEIQIVHNRANRTGNGREERSKQRLEMAERYFRAKIDADPTDRRSRFYLAGTYYDCALFDKARDEFEEYLKVSDWPEERYQASILLAQCYWKEGRIDDARAMLTRYMCDDWERAEAHVLLGKIALEQGRWKEAESWFKQASLKTLPISPMFAEYAAHTWEPHYGLWQVYQKTNDFQSAAEHGRQAAQLDCPFRCEIAHFEKEHTEYGDRKIGVIVDRGQMDFTHALIKHWEGQGKEVRIASDEAEAKALHEWADILWCDWCGDLAVAVSKLPKRCRLIIRPLGYENYSDHYGQVLWETVDDVVFISRWMMETAHQRCPTITESANSFSLPHGADTEHFAIAEGKKGNKIAMACYLNQRKNIPLALQIVAECPDKELHIVGEWQDVELMQYVDHMLDVTGLRGRVFFYQRVPDLNAWYADKDYYLSSSVRETFHYSLAEAMAAGLKPVIHDWISCREFYPDKYIFGTVDQAVAMLGNPQPQEYRDWVVDNLSLAQQLKRLDRIIERPAVSIRGEPKFPDAAEHRMGEALQLLGCRTDDPEPTAVLMWGPNPAIEPWMESPLKVQIVEDVCVGDSEKAKAGRTRQSSTVGSVDLVIAQNPEWVEPIRVWGAEKVVHIPVMGAVYPFRKLNVKQDMDVGFFGYITGRRKAILDAYGDDLDVNVLHECYAHETANTFLNRCKVVINIHAWDEPIIPWRICEAMSAGCCIVTEPLPKGHPFPAGTLIETDDIPGTCKELLANEPMRAAIAKQAHSWIWNRFPLERQMEKVLEAIDL